MVGLAKWQPENLRLTLKKFKMDTEKDVLEKEGSFSNSLCWCPSLQFEFGTKNGHGLTYLNSFLHHFP